MNEFLYDQIEIGMKESFTSPITIEMEERFREISGDMNPLHWDDAYAGEIGDGRFKGHVAFGMLTASLYSTIAGVYMPGKYSLIHSMEIKFQKPVYAGDVLTVTAVVTDKQDGLNLIGLKVKILNQDSVCVSKANMKVLVLK